MISTVAQLLLKTMTTKYVSSWGPGPIDGDVRPFGVLDTIGSGEDRNNQRHHFVSAAYMNGLVNERGRVHIYRCEAPADPHPMKSRAIGYERYYYSQKLPDGDQENHRFEDLWGTIETVWPEIVRALVERRLSSAISFNVLGMANGPGSRLIGRRPQPHSRMKLWIRRKENLVTASPVLNLGLLMHPPSMELCVIDLTEPESEAKRQAH